MSWVRSISSIDVSSVLTSTTNTVAVAACQARTSMEPRSEYIANVTSGRTDQPALSNIETARPIKAAWPSSSSRSMSPPRQRSVTRKSAPSFWAMVSSTRSRAPSTSPRSIMDTRSWLTPAAAPRSSWRRLCRILSARMLLPSRVASTCPILACTDWPAITQRSRRGGATEAIHVEARRRGERPAAGTGSLTAKSRLALRQEPAHSQPCTRSHAGRRHVPPGVPRPRPTPLPSGRPRVTPQYSASRRIPSAIFSGLIMNQSSRAWLYGTPGTSGPASRVTGPSR